MANMNTYHPSTNDEFPTPQDFFDKLDAEFHFDLDPCSTDENAKCKRHFTREQDGLKQEWTGRVWMNPPYGRECGKWVKKAFESVYGGGTAELVVCLLPARTGSSWFHDYCKKGTIRFIRGRLKFNTKDNAPFDSIVVIFKKDGNPMTNCSEFPNSWKVVNRMPRLIDADELAEAFEKHQTHLTTVGDKLSSLVWQDAKFAVWDAPTVDAVPVIHARWERWVVDVAEHPWHCSHCGWPPPKHVCHIEDMEYCSHCGARMDEPKEGDSDGEEPD